MGAAAEKLEESPAPRTGGRVLLVDDDEGILRAFARVLRADGYDITTASSAEEAIRRFGDDEFHAVVSDITMPGMSGIGLIDAIHRHDEDTPIVLITGMPTVETAIQAMDHGAMRYLLKPVKTDELRAVVAAAVRRRRAAELQRHAVEALEALKREEADSESLRTHFDSALDQLFMVYQPIVSWRQKRAIGYEALVRSKEPTIPHPGALFDAAERLDALQELSRAIRAKAPLPFLTQEAPWRLFYNLHVRDLADPQLYDPDAPLAQIRDRVVLEITERAALEEVPDANEQIQRLRAMGFSIAVDDLGAGYAGLNSFTELEPDIVKLDMSLVRNVHTTPTKQKVVRSINTLCNDMGIGVVAEGVENTDERDMLLELGCDLFQGYFFARPSPPFVTPRFD